MCSIRRQRGFFETWSMCHSAFSNLTRFSTQHPVSLVSLHRLTLRSLIACLSGSLRAPVYPNTGWLLCSNDSLPPAPLPHPQALERVCNPVLNKPKPKPATPPATPNPPKSPQPGAQAEQPAADATQAPQAEEPKDMDVD